MHIYGYMCKHMYTCIYAEWAGFPDFFLSTLLITVWESYSFLYFILHSATLLVVLINCREFAVGVLGSLTSANRDTWTSSSRISLFLLL